MDDLDGHMIQLKGIIVLKLESDRVNSFQSLWLKRINTVSTKKLFKLLARNMSYIILQTMNRADNHLSQ